MNKHIMVCILCGLGMGMFNITNTWGATCRPLNYPCTRSGSNPAGDCCLGYTCLTEPWGSIGEGVCQICDGCTDCSSKTESLGAGYQKVTTRRCECSTCKTLSTSYQCTAGYYGRTTNGTSGCTRCPAKDGVYGTSPVNSSAVTACYIPANSTASDTKGGYKHTDKCNY